MLKDKDSFIGCWIVIMFIVTCAIITVLGLFLASFFSCSKEPYAEHLGTKHDSVPFIVKTGNLQTIISIECWETALWTYKNGTYRIPAYHVTIPYSDSSIYYRRYTVHVWVDSRWEYVGHGIVQDTNYIIPDSLNKERIILSDCI